MSDKRGNVERNYVDKNLEKTIILNVGGTKYETYKSILTAHEETLLGTMFSERNNEMLHPTNGNEYFIDRDGKIFRYIVQYYRTGRIYWPTPSSTISRQELEDEYDYYQIPFEKPIEEVTPPLNPVVEKLNGFVFSLRTLIKELIATGEIEITITFSKNGWPPFYMSGNFYAKNSAIMENVDKIVKPFGSVGYNFLDKFGSEIGGHLSSEVRGLSWRFGYSQNREQIKLHMSFPNFLNRQILEQSCLNSKTSL
ncbi:139_t:CDS:2 [Acaulospora morrowiae]|uniref:139_t:CDS:1 n=1 Tax=Acaulospora morrowiae TaxID=94023 RepID=A0A9N9B7M7_9GLOM|nr:139_t:CDS:2 [Acaulospora morrowiae]